MGFIPGMTGPSSMKKTLPFELAMTDNSTDDGGGGTSSWTGVACGAAPVLGQRRYMILGVGAADASPFSLNTPTMNGNAMTAVVVSNAVRTPQGIWIAELTSGTTADFAISMGSAPGAGVGMVVARMINPSSATPFDTVAAGHSGGIIDLSMDVSGGGGAFAIARCINGGGAGSNTWTGLSEQLDIDPFTNDTFTAALDRLLPRAIPRTIGVQNSSGAPNTFLGVGASWAA